MNILSTIHSKYQGETMFCFVCVATVFGYILGVNRVIDAIISKHSDETRVKIVKTLNKYTQTNFSEIAEFLASNNLILSRNNENDVSSSDQGDNNSDSHNSDHHDHNSDDMNDDTSKVTAMLNSTPEDDQEKQKKQEKQENATTNY